MREIKFKAYHEKYGMSEPFTIGDDIEFNNAPNPIKFVKFYIDELSFNNNFIYLEYIGLKDKHGVEIYEGDILGDKEYDRLKWVVVYQDCGWYGQNKRYGQKLNDTWNDLEVIGNVFLNPELAIEKEND